MQINDPLENFKFDLERIIDDFIIMCFFAGNDFSPSLSLSLSLSLCSFPLSLSLCQKHICLVRAQDFENVAFLCFI